MKKLLTVLLACMLVLTCFTSVSFAEQGNYTTFEFAQTTGGEIRGYKYNDVYTFLGIPYAQAERFEEPEDTSWEGILNCATYGPVSPQYMAYQNGGNITDFSEYAWADQFEDENCQNLNVWTKSLDPEAKKPVIVWYHGGGYSSGSSIEGATYDGHNLADYGDIVFVSVNARLNYLGYTDLSAFGDAYKHSGNLGMMDNQKALEWVNKNIVNFGGDPENVTILGQSGGGGKVMCLMGMPSAAGLFQKVWAFSGSIQTGRDPEEARQDGVKLAEYLGIQDLSDEEIITYLKAMPYNELSTACKEAGVSSSPVQDGEIYQGTVIDGQFTELAQSYPLILSSVFSEMGSTLQQMMFLYTDKNDINQVYDPDPMVELTNKYGDSAEAIAAEFQKVYPCRDLVDVLTINEGRSNDLAIAKANSGGQIWQAVFAYKLPVFGGSNSWHTGGDIPFVFHNADKESYLIAGDEENAYAFQDVTSDALIAYAYTGDPSTESLAWPQFTVENGETMIFDNESMVENYHDTELMRLLSEVPSSSGDSESSGAEEAEEAEAAEGESEEGESSEGESPEGESEEGESPEGESPEETAGN